MAMTMAMMIIVLLGSIEFALELLDLFEELGDLVVVPLELRVLRDPFPVGVGVLVAVVLLGILFELAAELPGGP